MRNEVVSYLERNPKQGDNCSQHFISSSAEKTLLQCRGRNSLTITLGTSLRAKTRNILQTKNCIERCNLMCQEVNIMRLLQSLGSFAITVKYTFV